MWGFPVFEFNYLHTARSDISFQGKNERYTMDYALLNM